jgi:hypothetical protein
MKEQDTDLERKLARAWQKINENIEPNINNDNFDQPDLVGTIDAIQYLIHVTITEIENKKRFYTNPAEMSEWDEFKDTLIVLNDRFEAKKNTLPK